MKLLASTLAFLALASSSLAVSAMGDTYISTTGVITSSAYNAGSSTSINFGNANIVYTTAACGSFTLSNMVDGGSYTLVVKGSGTGPATFTHAGLTVHSTGTFTCTSAKHTIFSLMRAGTDVYITMVPGF